MAKDEYLEKVQRLINKAGYSEVISFEEVERGFAEGYLVVIARIEDIVYNQKFSGAASGFLNPNIIARDLGLADKTESKVHTSVTAVDYTKLSDEAIEEIINATRSNEGESGEGS